MRYMRGGLHEADKAAALNHAWAAIEAGADDATTLATAGFVIGLVAHDDSAYAVNNALTLKRLVNASSRPRRAVREPAEASNRSR